MASKIMSIAAFAALAMAIPNHPEHMGKSNLARDISFDGSCGSWSGATCPGSQCCSVDGWCGTSETHCGTGCQAGFGKCAGGSSAPVSQPAPVSPPTQPSQQPPVHKSSSSSAVAPPVYTHTTETGLPPASTVPITGPVPKPTTTSPPVVGPSEPASKVSSAKSSSSADAKAPGLPGHPAPESSSSVAAIAHPTTATTNTHIPTGTLTVSTSIATDPAKSTGTAGGPGGKGSDAYTVYKGDGSSGAGWPSMDKWVADFETMWAANAPLIKTGCAAVVGAGQPKPDDNSDAETAAVKQALQDQSKASGVDPRFALAIMMQESKGCVRVHSTNYGVENPGIFQDHNGKGKCNNDDGTAQVKPCPDDMIKQMVKDGVDGTATDHASPGEGGDGLKQVLAANGKSSDSSTYYKAARAYNSGSIDKSGNLEAGIATHCYSSDVANRLTGWVMASSSCPFDKA